MQMHTAVETIMIAKSNSLRWLLYVTLTSNMATENIAQSSNQPFTPPSLMLQDSKIVNERQRAKLA